MCKIRLTIALIVIGFVSANLVASIFSTAIEVRTLSPQTTEISFTMPGIAITELHHKNGVFHSIDIDCAIASGEIGLPDVPHFSVAVAIPLGSEVSLSNATISDSRFISHVNVFPVQNYQAESYTFDIDYAFYQSKDASRVYPVQHFELSETISMRDYDIVVIKINPIRFFPARNEIEIIDEMTLSIQHNVTTDPVYQRNTRMSRAFEPMYRELIANYSQIALPNPTYQEPSILVIYGGAPPMTTINNFVHWKQQKGFEVVAVSTSIAGSTNSAIRNYILNAINTWQNPPEHIILIGQANTGALYFVPGWTGAGDFGTTTDYYFTQQVMGSSPGLASIGRISVNTAGELASYVAKVLRYERDPLDTNPANNSWYYSNLLVSESYMSGTSSYETHRYIKSLIKDYNPQNTVSELYEYRPPVSSMMSHANNGLTTFSYRGWSGMNGLPGSITNMTNVNRMFNAVWITCSTGGINGSSATENVMRRTHNNLPAGAITAAGMSTASTATAFNNALSGAIYYGLYATDMYTMGQAVLYAKKYLMIAYPNHEHAHRSCNWLNLNGDPSLDHFKTMPRIFGTSIQATLPAGTQALRYHVIDSSGLSVPDAWVTIINESGTYVSKGFSDREGVAFLPLDPTQPGPFVVNITKPGFAPRRAMVSISTTQAMVAVSGFMVGDSPPNGNGNGQINPGETIQLTLQLKNFLPTNVSGLSATMSSESELITIENATASLGNISAGMTEAYPDVFTFVVSPLTPDKTLLPLTFTITDGSSTWVSHLLPEIRGVDLEVVSMTSATGTSFVNINSDTAIYFTLRNSGSFASNQMTAKLISRSIFLTVRDSMATIQNINPGASANHSSSPFVVNVSDVIIPGMSLRADIHVFNDAGYEAFIPIRIAAGNKTVTDPTGPDDYGYIILDWLDDQHGYEDEDFTYRWIDIKSTGVNTGITDITAAGQEGNAVIMLPFTAKFYGVEYDRITVCSNGWFAFGEVEQKDFRNLPIPGPIVPKAMVAVYWTDLVVNGTVSWSGGSMNVGGIYQKYDQTENAFIIQWDRAGLVAGYSGDSNFSGIADSVSFQVLIYDPVTNGTAMGDSKIKMQYRRFHPGLPGGVRNPFQHITVGIQDHTGKRGLQYTFNDVYSPGSRRLTHNSAILITSPSFIVEQPHIQISRTYFHQDNHNTTIKAGDTLNIGVSLINFGMSEAIDVVGYIDFSSPYIEVLNDRSDFNNILSMATQSNLDYFTLKVSNDTPNNQVISGRLRIEAQNGLSWTRDISFTVSRPHIVYRSFFINDSAGNNDGIVDEGENVLLIINMSNPTNIDIDNVVGTLSSLTDLVTVNNAIARVAKMRGTGSYQFVFDITVAEQLAGVVDLPLSVTFTSDIAPGIQRNINLSVNQSSMLLQEDFSAGWYPVGWTVQGVDLWSSSMTDHAGGAIPEVLFTGAASSSGTTRLVSTTINTTDVSSIKVSFRHAANVAQNFGGTNIGIAIRAGNQNWTTVWSRELNESLPASMQVVEINNAHLLSLPNFQVSFFVEGSPNFANLLQWYIDDVAVQTAFGNTAILSGRVYVENFDRDMGELRIRAGEYSTVPADNGDYALYLLPASYPIIIALDPFVTGNAYYDVNITPGQLATGHDFFLLYKSPVNTLHLRGFDDNTNDATIAWHHSYNHETDPSGFVRYNIFRQVNSTQYSLLATTTDKFYVDRGLIRTNRYRYYVTVTYQNGDSQQSEPLFVDPVDPVISESDEVIDAPLYFTLAQNYPNPFNPTTNISFTIPENSQVSVKIYNIKGQLVRTLKNEHMLKGHHTVIWHGDNQYGKSVSSGIYFIKVQNDTDMAIMKSLLLK
jgi:hypothetical protein